MLPFSPYEKMTKTLRKGRRFEKEKWVVTEKIHGANFSFVYQAGSVRFARRRGYLCWEDSFFGFQTVASSLEQSVREVFDEIALEEIPQFGNDVTDYNFKIVIYGELFGGAYPHSAVEPNVQVKAIQKAIYYSPEICFCAFDIALETQSAKQYFSYERSISLFKKHGLLYAKPLLIGSMTAALNFDTNIDSTIPKALGLPPLSSNLIEGVVVKPYSVATCATTRPIFKMKNKEFDEDDKYSVPQRWEFIPQVESLGMQTEALVQECVRMVTPLRLASAISKVGDLDHHYEEVKEELRLDIFATYEGQDAIGCLSRKEVEWAEGRIDAAMDILVAKMQTSLS